MRLLAIPWHAIIKVMELAVTLVTTIVNAKRQVNANQRNACQQVNANQQVNAKKEKDNGKDSDWDPAE